MPARVWRHLIFAFIAALFVGLGLFNQVDPQLRVRSTIYDTPHHSWNVAGEVAYPSAGTLNYPGGQAKVMERVVPFALTIPDSSASISYEEKVLPLAIAATKDKPGHRKLNVLALEGSWIICYGVLWLGWWLFRRTSKEAGDVPR